MEGPTELVNNEDPIEFVRRKTKKRSRKNKRKSRKIIKRKRQIVVVEVNAAQIRDDKEEVVGAQVKVLLVVHIKLLGGWEDNDTIKQEEQSQSQPSPVTSPVTPSPPPPPSPPPSPTIPATITSPVTSQ